MRTRTVLATLASLGGMLALQGCWDAYTEVYRPLTDLDATGGTGGSGGGTTAIPPECIPQQTSVAVADTCGVFVSSSQGSDDSGDGTKAKPFATLGKAMENGSRVYACAEVFEEGLALEMNADIYGGLDCTTGWTYVGETTKSTLQGPADVPAVRARTGASLHLEDVAVLAADA